MGSLTSTMGKRAEHRPEISQKLLGMVSEAKSMLGQCTDANADLKAGKASPRPQATPVRSSKVAALPEGEAAPVSGSPAVPRQGLESPAAVPMSIQSTPVKSPDLKRLKSNETTCSTLPSLPSYSTSKSSGIHGLDSKTTLDMQEYFSQMRLSGRMLPPCSSTAS